VSPGSPVNVTVSRFDVDATFRVVELMNGIVMVSELNVVLTAFDVIPAVNKFVVITAFEAYTFPTTWRFEVGVFVPMPTRLLVLKKMFAVDAATPDDTKYRT
jgi:hypothetical protein